MVHCASKVIVSPNPAMRYNESMNNLEKFCEARGVSKGMTDAFIAYCRFAFGRQYELMKDGDTVKLILSKMSEEQVEQAWKEFVNDFSKTLPKE